MADNVGGFISVFEQRVGLLRKKLKKELEKKKSERNKHTLKTTIKEIKSWEDTIKLYKKQPTCPHCGKHI